MKHLDKFIRAVGYMSAEFKRGPRSVAGDVYANWLDKSGRYEIARVVLAPSGVSIELTDRVDPSSMAAILAHANHHKIDFGMLCTIDPDPKPETE